MPNLQRLRLLLISLVVVVALIPFWLGAPAVDDPVAAAAVPSSYVPWPPFVLTWQVADAEASGEAISPISSRFGSRPCRALEVTDCHVRLAWDGFDRWSLTASTDAIFDAADPRQLTIGPMHYVTDGAVVIGIWSTDRVPPLHVCHRMLRARSAGEPVVVVEPGDEALPSSYPTVAFQRPDGEEADCLGPWGIPVRHADQRQSWTPVELALRAPSDAEMGTELVLGVASHAVGYGCVLEQKPLRSWLGAVSGYAGYPSRLTPTGVALDVPDVAGTRSVLAWLGRSEQGDLPDGARQRLLGPGVVAHELLFPRPMISVPSGDFRLWVEPADDPRWTEREREAFILGDVARRLALAAADHPYRDDIPESCP